MKRKMDNPFMAETGPESRAFNEREFIAIEIAKADGKQWRNLPNVSTLWFKDKLHYRWLALRALDAKREWDQSPRSFPSLNEEAKRIGE